MIKYLENIVNSASGKTCFSRISLQHNNWEGCIHIWSQVESLRLRHTISNGCAFTSNGTPIMPQFCCDCHTVNHAAIATSMILFRVTVLHIAIFLDCSVLQCFEIAGQNRGNSACNHVRMLPKSCSRDIPESFIETSFSRLLGHVSNSWTCGLYYCLQEVWTLANKNIKPAPKPPHLIL